MSDNFARTLRDDLINAVTAEQNCITYLRSTQSHDVLPSILNDLLIAKPNHAIMQVNLVAHKHYHSFAVIPELICFFATKKKVVISDLIDNWNGFSLTKEIVSNLLLEPLKPRSQDIIKEELYFEQQQVFELLTYLLNCVLPAKKLIIAIQNIDQLPPSTVQLLCSESWQAISSDISIVGTTSFAIENIKQYIQRFSAKENSETHQRIKIHDCDIQWPEIKSVDWDYCLKINQHSMSATTSAINACINVTAINDANMLVDFLNDKRASEPLDEHSRYELHLANGHSLLLREEYYPALEQLRLALNIAEKRQNSSWLAKCHRLLYTTSAYAFELDDAASHAQQAFKFADEADNPALALEVHFFLSIWSEYFSDLYTDDLYTKTMESALQQKKYNYYAMLARKANMFLAGENNLPKVESACQASVQYYSKINNQHGKAAAYHELSIALLYRDKISAAAKQLELSYNIRLLLADPLEIVKAANGLGYMYLQLGQFDKSYAIVEQACQNVIKVKNWAEIGITFYNLANIYFCTRNYGLAARLFQVVISILDIHDNSSIIFHSKRKVLALLAICHFQTNNTLDGLLHLDQADSLPFDSDYGEFFVRYAKALKTSTDGNNCIAQFNHAVDCLNNIPSVDHRWFVYLAIEKLVMSKRHGVNTDGQSDLEDAKALAQKFNHQQTQLWLNAIDQNLDKPLAQLADTSINLTQIMDNAERDANKQRMMKQEAELNFRRKLDKICIDYQTPDTIAEHVCKLLYASFNLTEVAINLIQQGCEPSLVSAFPSSTGKLSITNHQVFPQYPDGGLHINPNHANVSFSIALQSTPLPGAACINLLALSTHRQPEVTASEMLLIEHAFRQTAMWMQFRYALHTQSIESASNTVHTN